MTLTAKIIKATPILQIFLQNCPFILIQIQRQRLSSGGVNPSCLKGNMLLLKKVPFFVPWGITKWFGYPSWWRTSSQLNSTLHGALNVLDQMATRMRLLGFIQIQMMTRLNEVNSSPSCWVASYAAALSESLKLFFRFYSDVDHLLKPFVCYNVSVSYFGVFCHGDISSQTRDQLRPLHGQKSWPLTSIGVSHLNSLHLFF